MHNSRSHIDAKYQRVVVGSYGDVDKWIWKYSDYQNRFIHSLFIRRIKFEMDFWLVFVEYNISCLRTLRTQLAAFRVSSALASMGSHPIASCANPKAIISPKKKKIWKKTRANECQCFRVWQFSAFTVRLSTNYSEWQRVIFDSFLLESKDTRELSKSDPNHSNCTERA